MSWYQWKPYVPVSVRRARTQEKMQKLRKKGVEIQPVVIEGRKIARTFWGQAWCDHLEKFSDFANRLPRGRAYVRNGSVCHLEIAEGEIRAMVSGSRLYNVRVAIKNLPRRKWNDLKERCAGQIGSLLELLQGRLSKQVMAVVTERDRGLFPLPGEITLGCDCPDWAVMCKHVAAVLYGVGARLDEKPELLFVLRGVDHEELISAEAGRAAAGKIDRAIAGKTGGGGGGRHLASGDLAEVFGIEMAPEPPTARASAPTAAPAPSASPRPRGPAALTGASVARLRSRLKMSQSQFARLLGVSVPSVGNWERTKGRLHLQARTREALRAAGRLTVQEARQRLDSA
jgi:uncharacterized Zn finger protein